MILLKSYQEKNMMRLKTDGIKSILSIRMIDSLLNRLLLSMEIAIIRVESILIRVMNHMKLEKSSILTRGLKLLYLLSYHRRICLSRKSMNEIINRKLLSLSKQYCFHAISAEIVFLLTRSEFI